MSLPNFQALQLKVATDCYKYSLFHALKIVPQVLIETFNRVSQFFGSLLQKNRSNEPSMYRRRDKFLLLVLIFNKHLLGRVIQPMRSLSYYWII